MRIAAAKSLVAVLVGCFALAGCRREYRVDPIDPPATEPPPAEPPPMPGFALPDAAALPDATALPGPTAPGNSQCAEEAFRARYAPVDLMLLVDSSLSMASPAGVNTTKWALTYEALLAFVRDPKSAGFGVGLQFFPTFPAGQDVHARVRLRGGGGRSAARLALREAKRLRRRRARGRYAGL